MDLLEKECQEVLSQAPADRPPHAILSLLNMVNQLVNMAGEGGLQPAQAFTLLSRAEAWCEAIDTMMHEGTTTTSEGAALSPAAAAGDAGSAIGQTPSKAAAGERNTTVRPHQLHILLAKDRTFTLLRDVSAKLSQWQTALRYAKAANLLDEELANISLTGGVTVENDSTTKAGTAAEKFEMQRLQRVFNAVRIAKNHMNMCVLYSKVLRHHEASVQAYAAVSLLRAIISSRSTNDDHNIESKDGGNLLAEEDDPAALLAGAMYNYGAELEQCNGRGREAQSAYNEALDLAILHLGTKHPLTVKLYGIVKKSTASTTTLQLPTVTPRGPNVFVQARPPMPPPVVAQRSHGARASSQQGPRSRQQSTTLPPAGQLAPQDSFSQRRPTTSEAAPPLAARAGSHQRLSLLAPLGEPIGPLGESTNVPRGSFRAHSSPIKTPTSQLNAHTVTAVAWDDGDLPVLKLKKQQSIVEEIDLAAALHQQNGYQGPATGAASSSPRTSRAGLPSSKGGQLDRKQSSNRIGGKQHEAQIVQMLHERIAEWTDKVTGRLYDDYCRRYKAALTIQRSWKCSQCRLETFNRRQMFYHHLYTIQYAAVQAITSCLRMVLERRKARDAKKFMAAKDDERVALERKRYNCATVINRNSRLYLKRKHHTEMLMRLLQLRQEEKLRQYDVAAVLAQRWWRVVKIQKAYWRRRQTEHKDQQLARIHAAQLDTAATAIQRIVRGRAGRNYFMIFKARRIIEIRDHKRRVKESTNCLIVFLREVQQRKQRLQREPEYEEVRKSNAAAKEQATWEDSLRRRALLEARKTSVRVIAAVVVLQRAFRCFLARKDLRYRRVVQRSTNQIRIDREFRQRRAAITIQCMARCVFARARSRRVKASYGRRLLLASQRIQRVARGYSDRTTVGPVYALSQRMVRDALEHARRRQHYLSSVVQAFCRATLSVSVSTKHKVAVEVEECLIYRRMQRERKEDAAAATIQSMARMHRDKVYVDNIREDLRVHKAYVQRMTLRMQCCFRVALAKVQLAKRRAAMAALRARQRKDAELQHEVFIMRAVEFDVICEVEHQQILDEENLDIRGLVKWHLLALKAGEYQREAAHEAEEDHTYDEL